MCFSMFLRIEEGALNIERRYVGRSPSTTYMRVNLPHLDIYENFHDESFFSIFSETGSQNSIDFGLPPNDMLR